MINTPSLSLAQETQPAWFERALALLLMLALGSGDLNFIRFFMGPINFEVGNPIAQLIWTTLYGLTALCLIPHLPRAAYLWSRNKTLLLLAIFVMLSVIWSIWPEGSARRAFTCVGSFLIATFLATRFTPAMLIKMAAQAMGILALISLALVLMAPDLGIMSGVHEGRWRGVFSHKNILGRHMTFSIFMSVLALRQSVGKERALYLFFIALSVLLLAFSQSTTAAMTLLIVGGAWLMVRFWSSLRHRAPYLAPGFAVIGLALVGALAFWLPLLIEETLISLGKTPDLTGRTLIWQGVIAAISDRPLLGYGYDVFWDGGLDLAHSYVGYLLSWDAPHAHNGILELTLNTGLVGLGLFLINFISVLRRVLAEALSPASKASDLFTVVLLLTLVLNVSEVTLLQQNNIFWVFYVVTAMVCGVQRQGTIKR